MQWCRTARAGGREVRGGTQARARARPRACGAYRRRARAADNRLFRWRKALHELRAARMCSARQARTSRLQSALVPVTEARSSLVQWRCPSSPPSSVPPRRSTSTPTSLHPFPCNAASPRLAKLLLPKSHLPYLARKLRRKDAALFGVKSPRSFRSLRSNSRRHTGSNSRRDAHPHLHHQQKHQEEELHINPPTTPCLWQAPASTQKPQRKKTGQPLIRRGTRRRAGQRRR